MKLRNKKTGEIGNLITICASTRVFVDKKSDKVYNTLAELTNEWEDCEEAKDFWYINEVGGIVRLKPATRFDFHGNKEIGNYFETLKEAKKAVEKLEAWKRLKDKGFRFKRYKYSDILEGTIGIEAQFDNDGQANKDLDLLFSQEDD